MSFFREALDAFDRSRKTVFRPSGVVPERLFDRATLTGASFRAGDLVRDRVTGSNGRVKECRFVRFIVAPAGREGS